jgi:hypothetical protein
MIRFPGVGGVRHTARERVATMQRARRVAVTAAVAALAATGLIACQREPGVAAYVGKARITEDRVDAVYTDARDKLTASVEQTGQQQGAGAAPQAVQMPVTRRDVVTNLVGLDVLRGIARERNLQPVQVQVEQVAQSVGLPPDTEFVRTAAEYRSYLDAFAQTVQPAPVSDADLMDVYQRLRDGGGLAGGDATFQSFKSSIGPQDQQVLEQNIGLRNALAKAAGSTHARVNPRYGDAEMQLVTFRNAEGQTRPLVVLSFNAQTGQPAVVDVP